MEHNIARMDFHSWLRSLDDAVGFRCPNPTDASAKNTRLESYGKLCVLGLIVMCFGRTADVLKVIHETNKHHGYYCVIYFTFSLLIMLMGLVTVAFSKSAPLHMFVAALGAWQAMVLVSLVAFLHLGLVEYLPSPENAIYLMMATPVPFTLYWWFSASDPWILYKIGRLVMLIIMLPYHAVFWLQSVGYQAGIRIQAKGINAGVHACRTLARHFPWYWLALHTISTFRCTNLAL